MIPKSPYPLFFARHGLREDMVHPEWKATAARPFDTPLSAEGFRQAGDLALAMEEAGVQAIYSSPFLRTVQTAAATSVRLRIPVRIEPGFAEFINREWFEEAPEFLDLPDLQAHCPLIDTAYTSVVRKLAFEKSEDTDLRRRVDTAIHGVLSGGVTGPVAIFTHGAALCQAVLLLVGSLEGIDTGMGAITCIDCVNGAFKVVSSTSDHLYDKDHIRRFH